MLFNLLFKVNLLAKHVGKSPEEVEADIRRPKYFIPSEAVEYGIIDKVSQVERVQNNFLLICLPFYYHVPEFSSGTIQ